MDYKRQIDLAKHAAVKWREKHPIIGVGDLRVDCMVDDLTRSISALLARAEAAERERDELREAMKPNCLLCDSMHENGNCTEVGGFCTSVPAAHCPLIPKLRQKITRAEARTELLENANRVLSARVTAAEERAERAEKELAEYHCRVCPIACKGSRCQWYRSQKEELA